MICCVAARSAPAPESVAANAKMEEAGKQMWKHLGNTE
jgi:hypothetical protein